DDVEVGQDVAPLVDDDARPQTRLMELLAAPGTAAEELVEKVLECGVVRERPERGRMAEPGDLHGPDVDDGGPNAVGHVDKGRLQGVGRVCCRGRCRWDARRGAHQERMEPEPSAKEGEKCAGLEDDTGTFGCHLISYRLEKPPDAD